MSFVIYIIGVMILIGALAYGALSLHVSIGFIALGSVVLTAVAAMLAVWMVLRKYPDR